MSTLDELKALKAEYAAREAALRNNAVAELKQHLNAAEAEVARIKRELAELTGDAVEPVKAQGVGQRLKPLVENSEEWNKVAKQISIVLKNYPKGLNGKDLAYKMGLTAPNEVKRVKPVIEATAVREGAGVLTRYFVKA